MNKTAFDQLKNKPAAKISMCIPIILLAVKIGTAGYEFGRWLKVF